MCSIKVRSLKRATVVNFELSGSLVRFSDGRVLVVGWRSAFIVLAPDNVFELPEGRVRDVVESRVLAHGSPGRWSVADYQETYEEIDQLRRARLLHVSRMDRSAELHRTAKLRTRKTKAKSV